MATKPSTSSNVLKLALPKGRMHDGVNRLFTDAGVRITSGNRAYRPTFSLGGFDVKILKPQNIVEMLDIGSRDIGFAGADWVKELNADVVEILDTELDPVRLVAAAPTELVVEGRLPKRPLLVVTEYQTIVGEWLKERKIEARVVRSYGATEVFPPEDADFIVDVAATGATLAANGLIVFEEILRSSTRLYASRAAWNDATKRTAIEDLIMVLRSVLEARKRVMLEVNVSRDSMDAIVKALPCMRCPTVSPLAGEGLFAVKSAVPRDLLPSLIPKLKALGGSDIVVSPLAQVVP
jgi:ATP phosphoribosyltransferase